MKKYHLNYLSITLGTKCNMNCPHCMGGNPKIDMVFNTKCLDNLCKDIYGIDELVFAAYEPSLYIDIAREIFDKIIKSQVRINRVTICTNARIYSQELTDFIIYVRNYVKRPERTELNISLDRFHFYDKHIENDIKSNAEIYKKVLDNICTIKSQNLYGGLMMTGRAKNLTKSDCKDIDSIILPKENAKIKMTIKDVCAAKENTCCNGQCITNCIQSPLMVNPNGHIYLSDGQALSAIDNNDYSQSIGCLINQSFSAIIENYLHEISNIQDFSDAYIIDNNLKGIKKADYICYQITALKREAVKAFEDDNEYSYKKSLQKLNDIDFQIPINNGDNKATYQKHLDYIDGMSKIIETINSYFTLPKILRIVVRKECQSTIDQLKSYEMNNTRFQMWQAYENWDLEKVVQYSNSSQ